ncbi:MAG: NYN domain-containing protein, partial [Patescibacteria group bacterium]
MSEEERKIYVSLAQVAQGTPYSQEYLSLLVRKGKLDARKFGRNWYTTKEAVRAYTARQQDWFLKKAGRENGDAPVSSFGSQASHIVSDSIQMPATISEGATSTDSAVPSTPSHVGHPITRFFEHIGREAGVLGLTIALSVAVGVAGVHGVQEWQAGRVSAVVAEHANDSVGNPLLKSIQNIVGQVAEKSSHDFFTLAALADEGLGVQKRISGFFAPTGRAIVKVAKTVRGWFATGTTKVVVDTVTRPALPEPAPAASVPESASAPAQKKSPASSGVVTEVTRIREITEHRTEITPADLSPVRNELLAYLEGVNAQIREYMRKEISGISRTASSASQSAASSIQMITVSQDIDNLDSITVRKGMTVASGNIDLTAGNLNITSGNVTADILTARTNLSTADITVGGGDLVFNTMATTTIQGDKVNAFSIATSTTAIPFLTFDTANYRIGIGTTSPGATFAVNGNLLTSGNLTIGGTGILAGSGTSTFAGISVFEKIPLLTHSFGTWSSGVAGSEALNAVLVVNPTSAAADTNLISASVNGSPRFLVDAEGDMFVNSLTSVGATTLSSTVASSFTVENTMTIGDAVGDVLAVYAGSVRHENLATTTVLNSTVNAFAFAASTTQNTLFSLDTSVTTGRVGIATSAPWGLFSIEQTQIEPVFVVSDKGTSTPHLWVDGTGNIGVSTSSPTTLFSIGPSGAGHGGLFYNGALGIATSSPGAAFAVATSTAGVNTAMLLSNLGSGYTFWAEDSANDTTPFVIQADGNVGIGATNPMVILHASQSTGNTEIRVETAATGNNPSVRLLSGSQNWVMVNASSDTGRSLTIVDDTNAARRFKLENTGAVGIGGSIGGDDLSGASMVITSAGNVGIGTVSPIQVLHVVGQCVTGDTLLKRRTRRKKKDGTYEDVFEDVRIDEIKKGDEILTLDENTGAIVVSRVNALMDMGVKEIYELITVSGKRIRTTGNHPYFIKASSPELPKKKPRLGIFFDNANMFYAQKEAGWKVDFARLKNELSPAFDVKFINFYSAVPAAGDPAREATLRYIASIQKDVTLKTKPLKYIKIQAEIDGKPAERTQKKGDMDVELTLDVVRQVGELDVVMVVSGDSDFLPLWDFVVKEQGKKIVFAGFESNMAWELRQMKHWYMNRARHALSAQARKKEAPSQGPGVALYYALYSRPPSVSSGGVWTKVVALREGALIAVRGNNGKSAWERIARINRLPTEQVYDIEVEGTHNFIGNDIVAHNTYISSDLSIGGNDINLGTGTATSTLSGGFGIGVGTTTPGAAFAVATSTAGVNTAMLL